MRRMLSNGDNAYVHKLYRGYIADQRVRIISLRTRTAHASIHSAASKLPACITIGRYKSDGN
jgi:hypothetical protein